MGRLEKRGIGAATHGRNQRSVGRLVKCEEMKYENDYEVESSIGPGADSPEESFNFVHKNIETVSLAHLVR